MKLQRIAQQAKRYPAMVFNNVFHLNAWCELLKCRHWKQRSYPLHETWFGPCVGKSAFPCSRTWLIHTKRLNVHRLTVRNYIRTRKLQKPAS
jgi:hypothetical protein